MAANVKGDDGGRSTSPEARAFALEFNAWRARTGMSIVDAARVAGVGRSSVKRISRGMVVSADTMWAVKAAMSGADEREQVNRAIVLLLRKGYGVIDPDGRELNDA